MANKSSKIRNRAAFENQDDLNIEELKQDFGGLDDFDQFVKQLDGNNVIVNQKPRRKSRLKEGVLIYPRNVSLKVFGFKTFGLSFIRIMGATKHITDVWILVVVMRFVLMKIRAKYTNYPLLI
jgi:hypothetical protein